MENKVKLKKYLVCTILISLCLLVLFLIINIFEYRTYTLNFNNKLSAIISKVQEEYPNISQNQIIEILNSNKSNNTLFKQYGIDLSKDSLVLENNIYYYKFLILNIAFVLLIIAVLISIFLKYNNSKDKEISEITKYIEEINRKNYTLHIDEISEDELSILKNEIYKTTIMLKENAENSLTDKKNLKKSLEDISHQLKTPLTSILIMLDNLIDDTNMDSNMREEFIRDIKKEVTNINFLVQSILKLSKFDSNTISFSKEKIYLKEIVEEAVKKLSSLCDLRNINIEISGDNKAQITGDFMWQVEAISNIVKNCVEHSNSNEKIIINYEQNNIYSSISIQDFGEGILKEDLPHIFERFYKGKNSTEGGIGIGLALAKTIIEEGNGSIDVKTSKNGTKFIIKYFKV